MPGSTEFQQSPKSTRVLDHYLLDYLDLLNQYNLGYEDLQFHIQGAFLNLSQSKVILGPSRIGPNSYDLTPRLPTKTILIERSDMISLDKDLDRLKMIENNRPFRVVSNQYEYPATENPQIPSSSEVSVDSTMGHGNGLRKRNTEVVSIQSNVVAQEQDHQNQTRLFSKEIPDPILQFTALPPPPLKTAQTGFSDTLDDLIRLANLRSILVQLHKIVVDNHPTT
ncbi:hypothetical protein MJO28_002665 [Puccinia striiformis f. sp. tritici]|uniref:Uncharacterized protein n=1 Tax=Puccinia striiformis f. sp. tritici TaxID=168172 RepID=A0ACC0ER39_9BASI|nr:hypothetical protein MJO28_002665 [Puccinia striiformis f. sp. tritici]